MIEEYRGRMKNVQFCWDWNKIDWDIAVLELLPFFEIKVRPKKVENLQSSWPPSPLPDTDIRVFGSAGNLSGF